MASESQSVGLSVVVAAQQAGPNLPRCLAELASQLAEVDSEILVVHASGADGTDWNIRGCPDVRHLELPRGTDVPRLWSAGIAAARGKIVALTIEQCIPEPGWAEQVLRAHECGWPAVGGGIELDPDAGLLECAIYFSRYSRYIPPFPPEFRDDLAGDNCSYKRSALKSCDGAMREGFWESFLHEEIRARGGRLLADSSIVMRYCGPMGGGEFLRRRYSDGRYFAARRARQMPALSRAVRAAALPVIPFLLFGRIVGRVWQNGRYRGKLLGGAPMILLFLGAWALGECSGYLFGATGNQAAGTRKRAAVDSVR